ncbi:MAG: biopolymer transporter ExbD [Bacteroidetes bacterium]|nr:biopolymer transporter ExbD [Bacteroidota bacterium]
MPKVKIPRKSTAIDMTAMCDVAFLLLTFFMLTSNFTKKEAAFVNTPASISEIKIPERNIMLILVDAKGKVFFGIDGQDNRMALLEKMGTTYNITFSQNELKEFSLINSFGVPMNRMKAFLSLKPEDRDNPANALGIPCDSIDNQFKNWVSSARSISSEYRIAIKADQSTAYPVIKKLMGTLQDLKENRYNLITSLETAADLENKQ